jgi:hypothetical protein
LPKSHSHYKDFLDLRGDGRVVLYKRADHANPKWTVRLKIPTVSGFVVKSTKTTDDFEARRFTDVSGCAEQPVIKWMDTPSDAFDHLSRFGLDALLDMGTARFWRRFRPRLSPDARAFDRAFEVRMTASDLLGVDEHDRLLMAPKLRAKSQTMSANASDREVFRVRAVWSQIGWLETSMAAAAAEAVSNVESLLSRGASEGSVAIDNQLKVVELHEKGLLATWETPESLICATSVSRRPHLSADHHLLKF